jgi:hypothetical protein
MRENDPAITQVTPADFRQVAACSRDEPHPKFFPAARMSPGLSFPGNSGSIPSSA